MKAEEKLRLSFYKQTGVTWTNSQEEPDIDYVYWLENKLLSLLSNKESEEEKEVDLEKFIEENKQYILGFYTGFELKHYLDKHYTITD